MIEFPTKALEGFLSFNENQSGRVYLIYLMTGQIQNFVIKRAPTGIRAAIILLLLFFSSFIPYKASTEQLRLILLGISGILSIIFFVRWPALGLIAIPLSGMFIKFYGPGGANATIVLVALLLFLWVGNMMISRRKVSIVKSSTMLPIIFLCATITLSLGMGQITWFPAVEAAPMDAQIGGYAAYLLSFGAYILTANQIKDLRWLKLLVWLFIILGIFYAVGSLIPATNSFLRDQIGEQRGIFWIWLVALTFSQILFNQDLRQRWRILLFVAILSVLYLLFVIRFRSKSGWLPVFVVLWVVTTLWSWRLGLLVLLGGALLGVSVLPDVLSSENYSLATRLEALPILFQIVRVNPIFGSGFANYYWFTPLFPIRGFYVSFSSHNNYVDIIVQTGMMGFVLYGWLISQIGILAWKLRRQVREGFMKAYVNGAIGGLVGMILIGFLGDWVLPFVYNIGIWGFRNSVQGWLLLGGLVAVEQIYSSNLQIHSSRIQK